MSKRRENKFLLKNLGVVMLIISMVFGSITPALAADVNSNDIKDLEGQVVEDDLIIEKVEPVKKGILRSMPEMFVRNQNDYKNLNPKKLELAGVDAWHKAGYKGQGMKIAIYDHLVNEDFYRGLGYNVTNMPAVKGRTFDPNYIHGNAVFHAMAQVLPEAEYHIYDSRSRAGYTPTDHLPDMTTSDNMYDIINISYTNMGTGYETATYTERGGIVFKSGGNMAAHNGNAIETDELPIRNITFNVAAMHLEVDGLRESDYGQMSKTMDLAAFANLRVAHHDTKNEAILGVNGTSMATPFAAGMAGLYSQRFQEVEGRRPTNAEARQFITDNTMQPKDFAAKAGLDYTIDVEKYIKGNSSYDKFTDNDRYGRGLFSLPTPSSVKAPNTKGEISKRMQKVEPSFKLYGREQFEGERDIVHGQIDQTSLDRYIDYYEEIYNEFVKAEDIKTMEEVLEKGKNGVGRNGLPLGAYDVDVFAWQLDLAKDKLPYEKEPTEPTDPVDPVEPTDPVDPTEPTDPVEPVEPTDPVDPTEPTDPVEPVDPKPNHTPRAKEEVIEIMDKAHKIDLKNKTEKTAEDLRYAIEDARNYIENTEEDDIDIYELGRLYDQLKEAMSNLKDKPATDKPGDKPVDKPGDKPVDKPGDKPVDKPGDKPVDKPAKPKKKHNPLLKGYPNGKIKPNNKITREEAASIIFNETGLQSNSGKRFKDVKKNRWSFKAINSINVSGYKNGKFEPNNNITRAEAVSMIKNNIGIEETPGHIKKYTDLKKTHWAHDMIMLADSAGVVNGYPNGTFKPEQEITRAEFVVMINNAARKCKISEKDPIAKKTFAKYRSELKGHWARTYLLEALISHDEK